MALSKDEAITMVKHFLSSCSGKHDIRGAYLFGSLAKGFAKEYSDVDLAIILGTVRSSESAVLAEDFEIFHEAQQYDSRLEVVCFSETEFNQNDGAIIRKIKREGIPVM
jgi:predicted nucleotidyltransferase